MAERQAADPAELHERVGRAGGNAVSQPEMTRIQAEREHDRAARQDAKADAVRERDRAVGALIRTTASEVEVKGLREALAKARRPFWRRWIG